MEAEVKQSDFFYRALAWAEANWRRLAGGLAALAGVALIVSFFVWRHDARVASAAEALSAVRPTHGADGSAVPPSADAYLAVAREYSGLEPANRARLLAAAAYFHAGKYPEAKTEFDRLLNDAPQSAWRSEALYGQGACLEALGKGPEAIAVFKSLLERFPTDPLVPRARLALGRLQAQNQPAEALRLLQEVARSDQGGVVGLMAETLSDQIKAAHPELVPSPTVLTNAIQVRPAAGAAVRTPTAPAVKKP